MRDMRRKSNRNPLADWLRYGRPGDIRGETEQEALKKAYKHYVRFTGDESAMDFEDFECELAKARGPFPQFRNNDTGNYETRLQLTETNS